jgi:hypothetical protein
MKLSKYGPKGALSPTLGDSCSICKRPLSVGDYTTLMSRSATTQYANNGTEVHWDCATHVHALSAADE